MDFDEIKEMLDCGRDVPPVTDAALKILECLRTLDYRVGRLEKAAEPKPDFGGRLEKAAKLYAKNCPNAWDMSEAETEKEFEKAFKAGARWAANNTPQPHDGDEKILTEPLDGCPCCNHTFEERRAYRLGYYAGSTGQEPDTCPQIDHAPFRNPWMEGFDKGQAEWELLNPEPEPDESEDEPCQP